jgi:hypothetical protein
MENTYKYTVAGHTFCVTLPEGLSPQEHLQPYMPFAQKADIAPLFSLELRIVPSLREKVTGRVLECLNDEAPYFWIFEEEDGCLTFGFSYTKSHPDCILVPSDDFRTNVLYVAEHGAERLAEFSLSNAMMLLYTFCTSSYDTLMVHASVIAHDGGGYMFLGRSGTGKSTHSRMWQTALDGVVLMNDDHPVLRAEDGIVTAYGSPWSGKTPCYKNISAPLGGIIRIVRAPHNKAVRLAPIQAYASLMTSCSGMTWDRELADGKDRTLQSVVSRTPCWVMECLPDEDAAKVCMSAVTSVHKEG